MAACAPHLESLLLLDTLAEEKGHLLNDDLFLADCLSPLVQRFEVRSSSASVRRISSQLSINAKPLPTFGRSPRTAYIRKNLSLGRVPFEHVFFQSFEEVSTLLFMLRNRGRRFHLKVTNNLGLDRFERHPRLSRLFLGAVFRRASTIFVHCRYERSLVERLFPEAASRVVIVPFHQIGFNRDTRGREERGNTILFVGPEQPHKSIAPMVDLIKADKKKKFCYVFSSMGPIDPKVRSFLTERENVSLYEGYEEDATYYQRIASALYVVLTHGETYRGRTSGILCDSLASLTPVISADIDPVSEFFQRFGAIGYLVDFENPSWATGLLEDETAQKYAEFQDNARSIKASCSMEAIRDVFRSSLGRSGQ